MKPLVIPLDPADLPSAQHKGIARTGHVYTKPAVRRTKWAIAKLANLMTPREKIAASWTLTKDQPWRATIVYAYKLAGVDTNDGYKARLNPYAIKVLGDTVPVSATETMTILDIAKAAAKDMLAVLVPEPKK